MLVSAKYCYDWTSWNGFSIFSQLLISLQLEVKAILFAIIIGLFQFNWKMHSFWKLSSFSLYLSCGWCHLKPCWSSLITNAIEKSLFSSPWYTFWGSKLINLSWKLSFAANFQPCYQNDWWFYALTMLLFCSSILQEASRDMRGLICQSAFHKWNFCFV